MTLLVNGAADFAREALAGYVAAESERVALVPGGVVRSTEGTPGRVALLMGGGSGHFPAFAGWVGTGFGHGAACGNTFASPSESQILSVAREAHSGGGILFAPINYAGDILHFGSATQTLRGEGIDARMVAITDDIASGPSEQRHTRRGIAGAFLVLKIAGAAAERGDSLDEVERIVIAANEATRTLGVAFSGCTLPGSTEPLFTVPAGRMAVGLGIHGEPGVSEIELRSAAEVADLLIDELFLERAPEQSRRVGVLVNGLGATKYDELFVVFTRVRERLEAAGMQLVAPVVGEQVTSLDMEGLSVSLTYLDDELEQLWLAPADIHSFSRAVVSGARRTVATAHARVDDVARGSAASAAAGAVIAARFEATSELLTVQERRLGEIDAVAGDGDHGAGMVRGSIAAAEAARDASARGAGAGTVLARAGSAWSDEGGGTSGALWGTGLIAAGAVLGDTVEPDAELVARAVRAFADAIIERGKARQGDKTMVDAILPFAAALESASGSLRVRWTAAAQVATDAAAATADIASRLGRSRIHGARSIGTPDAGATSFALIVAALVG